ncbi:DUF1542 domain-containing protein [Lactobacillus johnsonii]|uniref:LPXTG-motif cell wall anchor domain protein n=1 Tax=Lactobacillus johnsonii ATCC 33200 TaxID=525330 RepID=C2E676_LACJH|nr:DUF1542 domain-containing protein [Lactobacillus johnsonii]EEJ59443.1 LPXTG-motif cell wall anchor domain protein [Lactobacillus johnsonii ATCC 33200]KRK55899.1 hypothetical protein FC22_GL000037 [Lactobacillus johnsonii ATCC 33200]MCF0083527.1 DUF1542 domain-containing protein [Lactobacillus johnsonii]
MKLITDTNTQNNEDKTNNNQAQNTVTDNLDHSTVVASYKADTTNASEANKSSENTESKSDEKQAVTTETAKTEAAATTEAEAKNNATNDVAKKKDEAAAKADTKVDANKAVENVKTESATTNADTKNTETQTVKIDEEKVADTNTSSDLNNAVNDAKTEVSTNALNVNKAVQNASFLSANNLAESKVAATALAAEAEDPNAVTVSDAKGFINAIQNGTATTINVAKNLNLADQTDSTYIEIHIKNTRNIVIQSDNLEEKRTIDFSGYSFDMNTQNSVTFKDLNIYARSYWGLVYNAVGYTFDNVNFTGSQLIYTKPSINSTLTFKNTITANSVSSYLGPLDGRTRATQQNGGQQILQFEGGTNQIIFDENSNVTLTTEDDNALEIDGGTTTIDVKDGANVAINPHSKGNPQNRNGIGTGKVARAIVANAAKDAINNATTNATVTAAENKGIEDIANVNVSSLAETKQVAIDAIKQVQNAKNSQIEEAENLSADEQKNLIDQVNKIAQDAINKLNDPATTTNEVITDTRDKAIDQITNLFIPTLDSVKKDAQEAKIDEINKADNLTDQMKQNLIDQVDQVADNATKAINNAQTNDDVKEAETKGLEDINSIQVPSLVESKDDAIKEIDDALEKKTDEINAADLDQKQKDELINQITDIATETKTKVFTATTNAEVDAEAEAGIKAIEAVKIPARTADNSNAESHNSSTNVTPDHNNEKNNAQNTNQVSTKTESESKEQTVITNSVQPKRNAVRHKNGTPVNKKGTLPQTGKKDNSNLTLAGAALLGLAGVFSLFGLGDKRKKNK